MERYGRVVSTVLATLLIIGCATPEEEKARHLEKAQKLYAKGEWTRASVELKNVLQIDPRTPEACHLLGLVELKRSNPNAAFGLFARALQMDPSYRAPRVQLGNLLLMQGRPEEARATLRLLQADNPDDPEVVLLAAAVDLFDKRPEQAEAGMTALLARGVTGPDVYLLQASARRAAGNLAGAVSSLRAGVGKHPNSLPLHRALADTYLQQGRVNEAADQLALLLKLEPRDYRAAVACAALRWQQGVPDEARRLLGRLLEKESERPEVLDAVVRFYRARRALTDAYQAIQQGLEQKKNPRWCSTLALLLAQSGRVEEAVPLLRGCLRQKGLEPREVVPVKLTLARIQMGRGELLEAGDLLQSVLGGPQPPPEALLLRGELLVLNGDGAGAVTALKTVMAQSPQLVAGHLLLAEAYRLNRQPELAFQALQQARHLKPELLEVRRALARHYSQTGDAAAAERCLREVVAAHPDDPELKVELCDQLAANGKEPEARALLAEMKKKGGVGAAKAGLKLGALDAAAGNWDRAIAELDQVVRLAPNDDAVFERLIGLYLRAGQSLEAAELCRDRAYRAPMNMVVNRLLARALSETGANRMAEDTLTQAEAFPGSFPVIPLAKADLYLRMGEVPLARGLLERTLLKDPESAPVARELALVLAEGAGDARDKQRALLLAEQLRRRRPQDPQVLDALGWVHYRRGEYRQAVQALERAWPQLNREPVPSYHLGMALFQVGRKEEARRYLVLACRSEESFPGKQEAVALLNRM